MPHERFHYSTLDEVRGTAKELGAYLPLREDTAPLFAPLTLENGMTAANRIAFQPMEGTDGTADGAPGELTYRRYRRFAEGGPGIIWFEAVATLKRARASAHQLWLTEENLSEYQRMADSIRETSLRVNGYAPLIVMQATNSGRYSKPNGVPEPMIAYHCPPLEAEPLPETAVVTDDDLKRFEDAYQATARLCQRAGFDGMDVKCCHRYLASELLSAYHRPGPYGGSFENRTRFLKNCYRAARSGLAAGSDFFLTSRVNIYDGFEYPYGFGVRPGEGLEPDFSEAIRLVKELRDEFHIPLLNVTMGNPYKNPHVNRPYDHGNYVPDEHPLTGVGRLMTGAKAVQRAVPVPVIASGFSYLRQYSLNLAAAMIDEGNCRFAGFGRMAFAYPEFIHDIRQGACRETCVSCGGCASLLRAGRPAGCVVRDREVYSL